MWKRHKGAAACGLPEAEAIRPIDAKSACSCMQLLAEHLKRVTFDEGIEQGTLFRLSYECRYFTVNVISAWSDGRIPAPGPASA